MDDSPGDQLLDRVFEGDREALAELFAHYRERLRRIIAFRIDSRVSARIDVDDILQEVYLTAQKHQGGLRRESSGGLFVWFRLIAQQSLAHAHRQHLKTQSRDAGRDRPLHPVSNFDATLSAMSSFLLGKLSSPSQAMLRKELAEQLEAAVALMSELDREVLMLRHFEELTNQETSQVLNISEQAASLRYVRALRRLQQVLKGVPGFIEDQTT